MTLEGNYNGSIKGGSYVFIDIPAWLEMVNTYINPYYDEITEANVNLLTKDANGNFYSTTGIIEGGADSFLITMPISLRFRIQPVNSTIFLKDDAQYDT